MQGDDEALGRHQIRQQKLRITRYVEELVPAPVLRAGALIMVMQVDSPVNGSMYHTVISIVFPLPEEDGMEMIPGVPESGEGGTFRATIYRPLIDVTRDDVLDAFPEQFPGGRRTMERMAYRARDMAISHIEQEMGEGDSIQKREIVNFVMDSLEKYLERACIAPPMGKPFTRSPEEEVIAAVAKSNFQRKEYKKSKKKAAKMRRAREQSIKAVATPTKEQAGEYDSDPFDDLNRSTRTTETAGEAYTYESIERANSRGNAREPPGVRVSEMSRRERTAEVFSTREGATHGVEEYKSTTGSKHRTNKGSSGLKKMLKKMNV